MIDQLISFFTQHALLSGLFVAALLAFLINEVLNLRLTNNALSPEEAVQLINHQNATLIDIRSVEAFQAGHIVDSISIPAATLEKKSGSLQKYKVKPIIIICTMGNEASKVATFLKAQEYQVYVLKGGIQNWRAAGLPLVKK